MNEIKIKLENGKELVAQLCDYDGNHPEIVICIQNNGIAEQEICIVRPHEEDCERIGTDIDCLVWADENNEDYTHKFIIPQYKTEDEKILWDINKIKFEEKVISEEYETTTLYFIAPKEILNGKYPEAERGEISIEFPTNNPEASYASVMFSPTKDGVDYDWFDVDLSYDEIEKLINLAEKNN